MQIPADFHAEDTGRFITDVTNSHCHTHNSEDKRYYYTSTKKSLLLCHTRNRAVLPWPHMFCPQTYDCPMCTHPSEPGSAATLCTPMLQNLAPQALHIHSCLRHWIHHLCGLARVPDPRATVALQPSLSRTQVHGYSMDTCTSDTSVMTTLRLPVNWTW